MSTAAWFWVWTVGLSFGLALAWAACQALGLTGLLVLVGLLWLFVRLGGAVALVTLYWMLMLLSDRKPATTADVAVAIDRSGFWLDGPAFADVPEGALSLADEPGDHDAERGLSRLGADEHDVELETERER